MSITQDQFEKLNEMGISLWQSRTCDNNDTTKANTENYLTIDLAALASQQVFSDILFAVGLTLGEVSQQDNHLDLGLFNWYFTEDQTAEKIQWHNQHLYTPSLTSISKSPALKKQLWHILGKQVQ
jgi:hypothetical protein